MTPEQLLRRCKVLLGDIECRASGCYADTGHVPSCVRGRAERLVVKIDEHLRAEQQRWTDRVLRR